jgi:hypothetical protein
MNTTNTEEKVKEAAREIRSLARDIEELCLTFGNELSGLEDDKCKAIKQRDAALDVCRAIVNWDWNNMVRIVAMAREALAEVGE